MGRPVVVKTKILNSMVIGDFYEIVAATEVVSCNHPIRLGIKYLILKI